MSFPFSYKLKRHLKTHENFKAHFGKQPIKTVFRLKQHYEELLRNPEYVKQRTKNTHDKPLFVSEDDSNIWVIGSEETHNLHQTVFESLQQSGHDYTAGESEYDFNNDIMSTDLGHDLDYGLEPDHFLYTEKLFPDTHNYALCSDNHSEPETFSESISSKTRQQEKAAKKNDHSGYSSSVQL